MPVRPPVEPAWWTSGSIDGVAMRDALAGHDIGAVFRFLHQRGWSWAAIAQATDIGEQRVREIASGKRRVENYDVYVRVAVGLNIPATTSASGCDRQASETNCPMRPGTWITR